MFLLGISKMVSGEGLKESKSDGAATTSPDSTEDEGEPSENAKGKEESSESPEGDSSGEEKSSVAVVASSSKASRYGTTSAM